MPTGRLVYLHSTNNAAPCAIARRSVSSLARHQLPIRTGRKGPSCQSQAPKELLTNLFKDWISECIKLRSDHGVENCLRTPSFRKRAVGMREAQPQPEKVIA
jgi:hypothetical protein